MEKSTFDYHSGTKGKQTSIGTVYQELIELREHNRVLEKRVKTMQKQNIDMTKNLDFVGNSEPAKPMVQQQRKIKKMNFNDGSEMSGMAMIDQAVLQNARLAGDMGGAVMPPIPRENKRSYQELGAQPTLAQLIRKKR